MTQHVIFTVLVDLEIRIIGDFKTIVKNCLLYFYLFGHLLVDQLFHFLFSSFEKVGPFQLVLQFVVKLEMHEISMHVFLQHFGIDEILAVEFAHFLLADEFILVVYHFAVLFFELFGDVVHVGHPFRSCS